MEIKVNYWLSSNFIDKVYIETGEVLDLSQSLYLDNTEEVREYLVKHCFRTSRIREKPTWMILEEQNEILTPERFLTLFEDNLIDKFINFIRRLCGV